MPLEIILLTTNQLNKWPFLREGFDSCIIVKKIFLEYERNLKSLSEHPQQPKGEHGGQPGTAHSKSLTSE